MLTEERFLQLNLLHVFGLIIRHRSDEGVGDGRGGCCLEDPDSSSVVDYSFLIKLFIGIQYCKFHAKMEKFEVQLGQGKEKGV